MKVYENLKDKKVIHKICKTFYEKVYDDPWLYMYFKEIDQDHITSQQADFIIGALGGPKNFSGRLPVNAHPHMMINDEIFDLRMSLLREAMIEEGAPIELMEVWMRLDEAFRNAIVKGSVSELKGRYATDVFLNFEKPYSSKKKAS